MTSESGDVPGAGHLVPENVLKEIRAAATAARAARQVPGVVRLQPGLLGLLRQFANRAWERATGRPVPDTAGIELDLAPESVRVAVRIVVSIDHHAAEVGAAVHHTVGEAVTAMTGRPADVQVHIVEIELEPATPGLN